MLFQTLPSDETVYFMMSREITKGFKPYVDFFHAHPPLHLYLYYPFIRFFGNNLALLKSITLIINIISSILVYKISKERYEEKVANTSLFLFLTSAFMLSYSTFTFGLELSLMFFLISFYYSNKSSVISGVSFALCMMTRLHLAPLGLVILLANRHTKKFLLWSGGLLLLYYGSLITVPNFLNNVFLYHVSKIKYAKTWLSFLKTSWYLLILFCLNMKYRKDNKIIYLVIIYMIFLLSLKSIFGYYFLPVIAFFSIEGANVFRNVKVKNKRLIWVFIIVWILLANTRLYIHNTNRFETFEELSLFVNSYNKTMIGKSDIVSSIAFKTNLNIKDNIIDSNSQRFKIYDYTDSIVIYDYNSFHGKGFNCTFIRTWADPTERNYSIWNC
jgi:4-amino-4-deoxy-L-arabinose transferase-like glycosyltransferase